MQFDTPLRVTWTASSGSPVAVVADALAAAQVLEVALRAPLGLLTEHVTRLADLGRTNQVELVLDARELCPEDGLPETLASLVTGGLVTLAVDFTEVRPAAGSDTLPALTARIARLGRTQRGLAAAARPEAGNLEAVLRLAAAAAEAGYRAVKLLHPEVGHLHRAQDSFAPQLLTSAALAQVRTIFPAGWPFAGCDLLVHDVFLRNALLGEGSGPYGGCQAGRAMAHVDEAGLVYPCSALPIVLGDLRRQSLESIWSSDEVSLVRRHLADPPEACRECSRCAACRGGCRGLSYVLTGSWDKCDPACDQA